MPIHQNYHLENHNNVGSPLSGEQSQDKSIYVVNERRFCPPEFCGVYVVLESILYVMHHIVKSCREGCNLEVMRLGNTFASGNQLAIYKNFDQPLLT